MDHHSLVIGKCIGKNNYKYFMSYVLYAMIDSAILIIMSLPNFWNLIGLNFGVVF